MDKKAILPLLTCFFFIYDEITSECCIFASSIFHGEVITSNFGSFQADLTVSLIALNQSNL